MSTFLDMHVVALLSMYSNDSIFIRKRCIEALTQGLIMAIYIR